MTEERDGRNAGVADEWLEWLEWVPFLILSTILYLRYCLSSHCFQSLVLDYSLISYLLARISHPIAGSVVASLITHGQLIDQMR